MTLEEKAEEYLKENCCEMCMLADDCKADTVNCFSKDCYIKGYEAGLYDKHADREEDIIHLSKENAELKAEIERMKNDFKPSTLDSMTESITNNTVTDYLNKHF